MGTLERFNAFHREIAKIAWYVFCSIYSKLRKLLTMFECVIGPTFLKSEPLAGVTEIPASHYLYRSSFSLIILE